MGAQAEHTTSFTPPGTISAERNLRPTCLEVALHIDEQVGLGDDHEAGAGEVSNANLHTPPPPHRKHSACRMHSADCALPHSHSKVVIRAHNPNMQVAVSTCDHPFCPRSWHTRCAHTHCQGYWAFLCHQEIHTKWHRCSMRPHTPNPFF